MSTLGLLYNQNRDVDHQNHMRGVYQILGWPQLKHKEDGEQKCDFRHGSKIWYYQKKE